MYSLLNCRLTCGDFESTAKKIQIYLKFKLTLFVQLYLVLVVRVTWQMSLTDLFYVSQQKIEMNEVQTSFQ